MENNNNATVNIAGTLKKWYDILVTAPDSVYSQTFELDKTILYVRGVMLSSNRDDLMYYRGSQKIEMNRQEIFPEGYESKLLQSGINCPVNTRYFDTGNMPIGNGLVKIDYRDTSDIRAPFEPYRIRLYLDCELKP